MEISRRKLTLGERFKGEFGKTVSKRSRISETIGKITSHLKKLPEKLKYFIGNYKQPKTEDIVTKTT